MPAFCLMCGHSRPERRPSGFLRKGWTPCSAAVRRFLDLRFDFGRRVEDFAPRWGFDLRHAAESTGLTLRGATRGKISVSGSNWAAFRRMPQPYPILIRVDFPSLFNKRSIDPWLMATQPAVG